MSARGYVFYILWSRLVFLVWGFLRMRRKWRTILGKCVMASRWCADEEPVNFATAAILRLSSIEREKLAWYSGNIHAVGWLFLLSAKWFNPSHSTEYSCQNHFKVISEIIPKTFPPKSHESVLQRRYFSQECTPYSTEERKTSQNLPFAQTSNNVWCSEAVTVIRNVMRFSQFAFRSEAIVSKKLWPTFSDILWEFWPALPERSWKPWIAIITTYLATLAGTDGTHSATLNAVLPKCVWQKWFLGD